MKNLLYTLVLVLTFSCQSANKQEQSEKENSVVQVELVETKLNIGGMHCDMCVASIEKGVKELKGIEYVKASLEDSTTMVKFDASKVDLKQIELAINKRGYTVKGTL